MDRQENLIRNFMFTLPKFENEGNNAVTEKLSTSEKKSPNLTKVYPNSSACTEHKYMLKEETSLMNASS